MTTPPPMPSEPPTVHLPQQVDTGADDWWDRLYADEDQVPAEDPAPLRVAVPADRLPDWWADKPVHLGPEEDTEPEPEDTDPDEVDEEPEELEETHGQEHDADGSDGIAAPVPAPKAPAADSFWRGWAPAGAVGMQLLHPSRGRRLIYNASAAALGWGLHLDDPVQQLVAYVGREFSDTAVLILSAALVVAVGVLIDHKTRHWWPPLAWICRIPLATTLLALALAYF
ncbi:hypothetical protein ABT381_08140 [Streptomyces sp. NPDC000151]|uniref:hypothetical protein n=1 Tax=Streptomyces sp. NPDC000151 TaxID=3154244 RepID=UPI0033186E0A